MDAETQHDGKAAMIQRQRSGALAAAAVAAAWLSVAVAQTNPFEPAAIVDEQIITRYDVSQRAKQLAVESGGDEDTYQEQALESLISETLVRNAALQSGFSVTQVQVSERLTLLAQLRGVDSSELISFYESRDVDALTIGRWLESQLLQEGYIVDRFLDRAREAVHPADIEQELKAYEKEQFVEMWLHQLAFGKLDETGIQEVGRLRGQIIQAMVDGAKFPDIATDLATNTGAALYRDLGWQQEQAFRDPRLIDLMVSLPEGSVAPPLEIEDGGVSLFFIQERRVRTSPGVEPYTFDIAIISSQSPPNASNEQVEAAVRSLESVHESGVPCDEDGLLPDGVERRIEREVSVGEMSLQNRFIVLDLDVGETSDIALSDQRSGGGGTVVWTFSLCARSGGLQDGAARESVIESVRQQLVNVQLALFASEHVRELRQRADIEIR